MKLRDKYGWPLERIRGRYIQNFVRMILHTDIIQTWRKRHESDRTEKIVEGVGGHVV